MSMFYGSRRFLYHTSLFCEELIKQLTVLHLVRNVTYELFVPMQSKKLSH